MAVGFSYKGDVVEELKLDRPTKKVQPDNPSERNPRVSDISLISVPVISLDGEKKTTWKPIKGVIGEICVICMTKCPTMLFVPCGHIICCDECCEKYENPNCPMCRRQIGSTHAVYI